MKVTENPEAGERFGRLTIIRRVATIRVPMRTTIRFKVSCDCGREYIVRKSNIGRNQSCKFCREWLKTYPNASREMLRGIRELHEYLAPSQFRKVARALWLAKNEKSVFLYQKMYRERRKYVR